MINFLIPYYVGSEYNSQTKSLRILFPFQQYLISQLWYSFYHHPLYFFHQFTTTKLLIIIIFSLKIF
jgi:hypothetical protein